MPRPPPNPEIPTLNPDNSNDDDLTAAIASLSNIVEDIRDINIVVPEDEDSTNRKVESEDDDDVEEYVTVLLKDTNEYVNVGSTTIKMDLDIDIPPSNDEYVNVGKGVQNKGVRFASEDMTII